MEPGATRVEAGEWGSFNGVSVNEEAEFMAHMFPNNYLLTNNELDGSYLAYNWTQNESSLSNATTTDTVSFYSSDDSNMDSNFNHGSSAGSYDYLANAHLYSVASNGSLASLDQFPISDDPKSLLQILSGNSIMDSEDTQNEFSNTHLQLSCPYQMSEIEPTAEEKCNNDSFDTKKRSRISEKGKRNVRSKKNNPKANGSDNETNSSTSEEDSNGSQEMSTNGGSSSVLSPNLPPTPNSNGKTRASRGSATDPQSLYARKRRERINERLRTLQNLVPNGTKVDISTMLEEAVHYVKFLQIQIKLLSSDELWMYAPLAYNGVFPEHIGLDLMRKTN